MSDQRKLTILRIAAAMLLLALILPAAAAAAQPTAAQADVLVTTGANLRLRTGPSTLYASTDTVPQGTTLQALGRDGGAFWVYVDYNGKRGWLAAWLCTATGDLRSVPVVGADGSGALTPSASAAASGGLTATPTTNVLIRTGPDTSYRAIGTIPRGMPVPVLGESGRWLQVSYNGLKGWSAGWLMTVSGAPAESAPALPPGQELAVVTRIIDGDTIDVSMNNTTYRVRYIGVNTPEVGEPCAAEATAFNASLVSGQTVRMVKDVSETDRYGRLLRYVYVGERFVNAELVVQGYAQAATYPPDVANAALFRQLQAEANAAGRGCWASSPAPPSAPAPGEAACDCSGNHYNCADFSTHAQAQACFEYCWSVRGFDVHQLDRDNDRVACEALP